MHYLDLRAADLEMGINSGLETVFGSGFRKVKYSDSSNTEIDRDQSVITAARGLHKQHTCSLILRLIKTHFYMGLYMAIAHDPSIAPPCQLGGISLFTIQRYHKYT